jgi:glycosyltransferase involved in cell wall biosynthesis
VSPEKGIGVLIAALERLGRSLPYDFEFCSSTFANVQRPPEDDALVRAIMRLAERDDRIRIVRDVDDDVLPSVLAGWDAIVIPSLWLESGPQVVYEAFAVGTPVIGSRRGGIAELVRDGETGFLFPPGNPSELATLLTRFATAPGELRALRAKIPAVRTTDDVADDMLKIYHSLVPAP